MLDLIACPDLKILDAVQSLLTCLVIGVGKFACNLCEVVDRSNDETLCKIYAQSKDRDEESQKECRDPESKRSLDFGDVRHCNVDANIALASVVAVVDRNVR